MDLCPRCQFDGRLCLCREVPRVETRTAFVIVRHANEARRRSNSGRIAALALSRCEIVDRRDRRDRAEFEPPPGAWLLYPGGGIPAESEPRPGTVVVIDGTWREARRLFHQHPSLQLLPRLSFPPPPATPRLRRPPPYGMATLESMAHAVEALEGAEKARPLHQLFALFVTRSRKAARRAGKWLLQ
ncbi:MAG: DTW domain-containing protein [Planctomycetes bacterium]|nr:DTW domain-containing protein [Planctomycetota bacterium]